MNRHCKVCLIFLKWVFFQVSFHCPRDTVSSGDRVVDPVVVLLGDVQLPGEEALPGRESLGPPHHEPHVLVREQPNQVAIIVLVI